MDLAELPGVEAMHRLARWVLGVTLIAGAASCGRDGVERAAEAAKADRLREEVKILLDRLPEAEATGGGAPSAGAVEPGSASRKRGKELLTLADEALARSDAKEAIKDLLLAKGFLERALADLKKAKEAFGQAQALRQEAESSKRKADEAEARTNAPAEYEEARKLLELALRELHDSPVKSAQGLAQARGLFEHAAMAAKETSLVRAQLALEKQDLAEIKRRARERGAEEKAAAEWLEGMQAERDAERHESAGEPAAAVKATRRAQILYARALNAVLVVESVNQEAATGGEAVVVRPGRPPEPAKPEPPDSEAGRKPAAPHRPAPEIVPLDFDPADYPQKLSAEDEAFLLETFPRLSAVIRYDDATGAVTLDYTNGRDLERDVDRSKVPGNHLRFWDPYWTKPGNSSPGEEEFAFSFDANTSGFFFTPVPFRYRVRVEWEAQIQTMDQDASLACLVMLDRGKESYYMADFVHLSLVEAGSRKWLKPLGGPFAASPNSWFEKKRQVAMRVEYQMPDPAQAPKGPLRSGRLSVSYDLGGELEAANKAPAKARERGFVAFRWHRAKFQARRLRISGILDKERAVSLLRQKLNGAKAPRRQNAPERPRGETAPDPTGALVGHALGPRQADDQASPLDETWTRGLIHAP